MAGSGAFNRRNGFDGGADLAEQASDLFSDPEEEILDRAENFHEEAADAGEESDGRTGVLSDGQVDVDVRFIEIFVVTGDDDVVGSRILIVFVVLRIGIFDDRVVFGFDLFGVHQLSNHFFRA